MQSTADEPQRFARRSVWRKPWLSLPLSIFVGWLLGGFVQSQFITTVMIGGRPARQMTLPYPNLTASAVLVATVVVWHLILWRPRIRFGLRSLFLLVSACGVLCATLGVRYMTFKAQQRTVARLGAEAVTEYGRVVELMFDRTDRQRLLDADLEQLKYLSNVRKLSLRYARITDRGLAQLHWLPELQELTLGHTGYLDPDVDLVPIVGPTFRGRDVTIPSGIQLVRNDMLRGMFAIRNTKITNVGMQHLAQLKSLRVLCLDDTAVSDEGLKHLTGLDQLEELNLERTYATDDGLKWLTRLPRLERLWLSGTRYLTDAGMEHVAQITTLRELSPPWQTTVDGLKLLEKVPHLEKLVLTDCQASLRPISRLTTLRELTVPKTTTDAELRYLRGLKQLGKLDLSGSAVSKAAVQELQEALPGCQIVR